MWFHTTKFTDPLKNYHSKAAMGDLCWVCGITMESFPDKTREQIEAEKTTKPSFNHDWDLVRGAVQNCVVADVQRQDHVGESFSCGVTVGLKAAHVSAETFL